MFRRLFALLVLLSIAIACSAQTFNWVPVVKDVFPATMTLIEDNAEARAYFNCTVVNIDAKHGIGLTAGHCLEAIVTNPDNVTLTVNRRPAAVIAYSMDPDIGLVQFPPMKGDHDIQLGSAGLKMGEPIAVLGLSSGLPIGAQFGYVSQVSPFGDIFMDMMIMPGNSGGPIFDRFGMLRGITTEVRMMHEFPSAHLGVGIDISVIKPFLKANGIR